MTCHHSLWTAHMVERCQVWLYITALGLHAWSDDVGRGMTSPPLDSTHGRMTSGEACYHRPWAAHTLGLRQAWHDITALGQHTPSDYVGHGLTSPPLDNIHRQLTSGFTCHHRLGTTHSIKRHRVWHAIIAFGQHTRSDYVRRGMTSPPLDSTHGQTTSGVE